MNASDLERERAKVKKREGDWSEAGNWQDAYIALRALERIDQLIALAKEESVAQQGPVR